MDFFYYPERMIFQYISLGVIIFLAPLVPPILSPLGFTYTGILVIQKANPRILSFVNVGAAAIADIIIRFLQNRIIEKFTIEEKPLKGDHMFADIVNKLNAYFKKEQKIASISLRRERYIETRTGKIATFLFAIFCYLPVIPDIISTRLLYRKIKFPYFLIAVIIGKSMSHLPFIFIGKTLVQLITGRIGG